MEVSDILERSKEFATGAWERWRLWERSHSATLHPATLVLVLVRVFVRIVNTMEARRPDVTDDGLPDGFVERFDSTHNIPYFFNTVTQRAQWERPTAPAVADAAASDQRVLPQGWFQRWDETHGRAYYYDAKNSEAHWELPDAAVSAASAPAAPAPASPAPAAPAPDASAPAASPETTADAVAMEADAASEVKSLPEGFVERWDETHGRAYYFDIVNQCSQWEVPTAPAAASTDADAPSASAPSAAASVQEGANDTPAATEGDDLVLPEGWVARYDATYGRHFFFDLVNGCAQWEVPTVPPVPSVNADQLLSEAEAAVAATEAATRTAAADDASIYSSPAQEGVGADESPALDVAEAERRRQEAARREQEELDLALAMSISTAEEEARQRDEGGASTAAHDPLPEEAEEAELPPPPSQPPPPPPPPANALPGTVHGSTADDLFQADFDAHFTPFDEPLPTPVTTTHSMPAAPSAPATPAATSAETPVTQLGHTPASSASVTPMIMPTPVAASGVPTPSKNTKSLAVPAPIPQLKIAPLLSPPAPSVFAPTAAVVASPALAPPPLEEVENLLALLDPPTQAPPPPPTPQPPLQSSLGATNATPAAATPAVAAADTTTAAATPVAAASATREARARDASDPQYHSRLARARSARGSNPSVGAQAADSVSAPDAEKLAPPSPLAAAAMRRGQEQAATLAAPRRDEAAASGAAPNAEEARVAPKRADQLAHEVASTSIGSAALKMADGVEVVAPSLPPFASLKANPANTPVAPESTHAGTSAAGTIAPIANADHGAATVSTTAVAMAARQPARQTETLVPRATEGWAYEATRQQKIDELKAYASEIEERLDTEAQLVLRAYRHHKMELRASVEEAAALEAHGVRTREWFANKLMESRRAMLVRVAWLAWRHTVATRVATRVTTMVDMETVRPPDAPIVESSSREVEIFAGSVPPPLARRDLYKCSYESLVDQVLELQEQLHRRAGVAPASLLDDDGFLPPMAAPDSVPERSAAKPAPPLALEPRSPSQRDSLAARTSTEEQAADPDGDAAVRRATESNKRLSV